MNLPISLIVFRLLLAPIILGLAYYFGENAKLMILVSMYLGVISDLLDGIIARKQNLSTEKLRRMDSQTDVIFWLAIGVSTWLLRENLLRENLIGVWIILSLEILCYIISLIKFNKEASTHAILSKIWGITLIIAFTALIGFNKAGIYFYICIIVGILSYLDVILIILLLPKWTHDVPSSYHALKIRQGKEINRHKFFNG